MKVTLNQGVMLPIVLKYIILSDSMKKVMKNQSHGGTMDIMNVTLVKELRYYVPPIDLQQEFRRLVDSVEAVRVKQRECERELKQSYRSLMQAAFGGKLFQ